MTAKLLHLAKDEKFIDGALDLFDTAAPGSNALVVTLPAGRTSPQRIRRTERILAVQEHPEAVSAVLSELSQYRNVIIHGLSHFAIQLMMAAPASTRFLWLAWGYDVYRLPEHHDALYQPATRQVMRALRDKSLLSRLESELKVGLYGLSLPLIRASLRSRPRALVHWPISKSVRNMLGCVRRMSGCATVVPDEWPLVRRLGFRGEFFRYNYAWIEQLFPDGPLRAAGPNILVGNSSSPACNHVDCFHALSRFDLRGRKVVVPLSYGDERYRDHVSRLGSAILGPAFMPLLDFLPLASYNEILTSCGTVIMNHHRQQGVGNLLSALYMGARVFLNEVNPCYAFFTRMGARVFSLQRELGRLGDVDDKLSESSVEANREALRAEYSRAASLERAQNIVRRVAAWERESSHASSCDRS